MKISILTPDKEVFQGSVSSVKVPGTMGTFQVLHQHAPIVSSLEKGTVTLVTDGAPYRYYDSGSSSIQEGKEAGKSIAFDIAGGFIEVWNNNISLLVRGVK